MESIVKDVRNRYRNRVLVLRLRAGYAKQKEFARQLGIKPQILSEIESNKLFLSSAYALRIREVLGCSLDDLYERLGSSEESRG